MDLPGFGGTRPPANPDYTPSGHADALLCFLAGRYQEHGRPVHLVGNSLGGAIAVMVAARRPELVRSLALISPAMPDRRPDPRRVSDPRMLVASLPGRAGRRAREELATLTNRERVESVVRLCFGNPALAPEHRLAEAAAELDARARQPWAYEAFEKRANAAIKTSAFIDRLLAELIPPSLSPVRWRRKQCAFACSALRFQPRSRTAS